MRGRDVRGKFGYHARVNRISHLPRTTSVEDPGGEAAGLVLAAIAEAGLDARRFGGHPQVRRWWQRWIAGEMSREQFVDACRELREQLGS